MFGIKRSLADKYFSDWIRERDEWTCQRCKTEYEKPNQGLHNSHFHSRRNKSTRFEPDNCIALCMRCHQHLGENPFEHCSFFLKRLGQERFDSLDRQAKIPAKVDESAIVLVYKALLKEMKENRKVLK